MKRLLSLLLVIAMLFGVCTIFTACDGTSASSEDKDDKGEDEKEEKKTVKFNMNKTTVEETVVYEKHSVVLTVTDLEADEYSVVFYMTLENNTDATISFSITDAVVNGLSSVSGSIYSSVGAGDSVDVELYLYVEELKLHNMKTIGDLELTITTRNDDYYTDLDEGSRFTIQTSDTGYQHTLEATGEELFNDEGIRILLQNTVVSSKENTAYMTLFVENTDNDMRFVDLDNIMINGWVLPYASTYIRIMPGTSTITRLYLEELFDLGINKKDKIQNMYYDVIISDDDYDTLCDETQLSYVPGDKDFVQEVEIDGTLVYEGNGIQMTLVDIAEMDSYTEITLYFQNSSGEVREYSFSDMYINGNNIYRGVNGTLPAGAQALRKIQLWHGEELESFDDLEDIGGTLYVYDQYYNSLVEEYLDLPLD